MSLNILPVLLNVNYIPGADFAPKVLRNVVRTAGQRTTTYTLGALRYYSGSVNYDSLSAADFVVLRDLWTVCTQSSPGNGCLFWDYKENQLVNEPTSPATGDGTNRVFQIMKTSSAGGLSVQRKITRPVHGYSGSEVPQGVALSSQAIVVKDNGSVVSSSLYDVDAATGIITFHTGHAPINLHAITVSGYFFVPVMFLDDKPDVEQMITQFSVKNLRIEEVGSG